MKNSNPQKISYYFARQKLPLTIVAVSGVLYNIGMTAGPWFEGRLAQTLGDIIGGEKFFFDMISLVLIYIAVIAAVQLLRYEKRFFVRRFANNIARDMKLLLYRNLLTKTKRELEGDNAGTIMTKAIADVDTAAEGMRKFTTELFDTGVLLIAYLTMLVIYDWRLALISCIFPPFAFFAAERMKKTVSKSAALYKESAGRLADETLDRVSGALNYRILGAESGRNAAYGERLRDYEKKSVRSGLLETALQPLYQIVSMMSVIPIIYIGTLNVRGIGFSAWDIAAFTTFLTCFTRLAIKSSKAAKLFNAVQKASVSWKRIKPLLSPVAEEGEYEALPSCELKVSGLSFSYPGGGIILDDISFSAAPGQIIGVTGTVASGKTTLGEVFLGEYPYSGSIMLGERELTQMSEREQCGLLAYMGHEPELISASVEDNILLGSAGECEKYLDEVCMRGEVSAMADGVKTPVGSGGVRLSGGQQARLALARTLCHRRPVLILDDPFSALDRDTEKQIFEHLRRDLTDCIIILISHRLYMFPETDKVLWLKDSRLTESTHEALLVQNGEYRELYEAQVKGADNK